MNWWQVLLAFAGAFSIGGLAASFLDRRHASNEAQKARDHATREARATRLFGARLEAYKATSTHLERVRQWIEWTEPFMEPKPKPPDMSPGEAWTELSGTVAVTLSDGALTAMQAVTRSASAFAYAVEELRDFRDGSGKSWDESDQRTPRQKLEDARGTAFDAITHAQKVMRDELAKL